MLPKNPRLAAASCARGHFFLLAALMACPTISVAQDAAIPRPGGVMSSAPKLAAPPTSATAPVAGAVADLVYGKVAGSTEPGSARAGEDLSFLMPPALRPWPLRYRELGAPTAPYVSLPTEQEVKLMLPGLALDAAARVRQGLSRYVTDSIGTAAQDRGRQIDGFTAWADNVAKQKVEVPLNDDWLRYVFWTEVYAQLEPFRDQARGQAERVLQVVVAYLPGVVGQITPVMNSTQGYEQRTAWYNALVQLKEGVQLYQMQLQAGEAQLLKLIEDFEAENPRVARPEGAAPTRTQAKSVAMPGVDAPAIAMEPPARKPAEVPLEKPKDEDGGFLGLIILAALAAAIVVFFINLRKKVKVPSPSKD